MSSLDLEEALRRSEEFTARLIESSHDCIKVLDLNGHLLAMNAHGMAALEICDFGPLVGSIFGWVSWLSAVVSWSAVANAMLASLKSYQGSFTQEVWLRTVDKSNNYTQDFMGRIPEPTVLAFLGIGCLVAAFFMRRPAAGAATKRLS